MYSWINMCTVSNFFNEIVNKYTVPYLETLTVVAIIIQIINYSGVGLMFFVSTIGLQLKR